MFDRMLAAIAEILAANGAIHQARDEVIDAAISEKQAGSGMPLAEQLLSQRHAFVTRFGARELKVLAH